MPCDICGGEGALVRAKIEGSVLRVCRNCAKFGEIIPEPKVLTVPLGTQRSFRARKIDYRPDPKKIESEQVLVSGYGGIVRKKREHLGLSQKDLAQKLNERESLVRQIEHEHIKPDGKIVRKIQKILGIKLLTVVEEAEVKKTESSEITLADIAKVRKT